MKQKLLWIPKREKIGTIVVPYKGIKPSLVWTLYHYDQKDAPPKLPYKPIHHVNAFVENRVHDWDTDKDTFRYYSRVCDGGVWLLLEFKEDKK